MPSTLKNSKLSHSCWHRGENELAAFAEELKAVEQQLAGLPDDEGVDTATDPTDDDPNRPADDADNSETPGEAKQQSPEAQPTQREQLVKSKQHNEKMVAAMQRAKDYGPQIMQRTTSATQMLQAEDYSAALPDQTEALRMLKEIKDALPKKDPQQDENQDQQNNQQNDQDQKPDDNKQDDKEDKNENKDDEQQDKKQESQQSEQEKQKQQKKPQPASRDQAEAMLRKVRERERKHRELQDKFRRTLMIPGKVERDW